MIDACPMPFFQKMIVKQLSQRDGTVFSSGTTDRNHQLTLPFITIERNHVVDQTDKPLHKALCLFPLHHVGVYRFIQACERFEFLDIKWIRQTAHIKETVWSYMVVFEA